MPEKRSTVPWIRSRKGCGVPLVMVTAYDAPTARIVDGAGVDVILVGDTLAMVVLGFADTLHATLDDMVRHTAAVARAAPGALVLGDLPWLSYHASASQAVRSAGKLVRAGAEAVKLEGGRKRLPAIRAILDAEIPVMGHLGLTPQSVHVTGGFKLQARETEQARVLIEEARALADAGCFALVLDCVPAHVARAVTESIAIPTIGIGAGPHCDGQVLVFHDLLGLEQRKMPRFVRQYAALEPLATEAVKRFADDVRGGRFPSPAESYAGSRPRSDELASSPATAGKP